MAAPSTSCSASSTSRRLRSASGSRRSSEADDREVHMISRRDFLRSAGGLTVLALTPAGRGVFAAPASANGPRLPLFTTLPYIQPGYGSTLKQGQESMIVTWQTHEG